MTALLTVVAALVAARAVHALRRTLPPPRRARSTSGHPASAPIDLEQLERVVAAAARAGDLHTRLRPLLREVAATGLRRRGVDLDGDPTAARAALAADTWELVRSDRRRPDDPFGPGFSSDRLAAVLDDLEALLR